VVACVGDIARWPHPLAGGASVRIEHWSNAAEMAPVATANLLAPPEARRPYAAIPSFWSDQYDVKLQSIGFPHRATRRRLVAGALADRRFVLACERETELVGAIGFNAMRAIAAYRRELGARAAVPVPA
jgi:3-phenylpropionate/trans-cinnamate dioxygenase ferredoxin reductase subunit